MTRLWEHPQEIASIVGGRAVGGGGTIPVTGISTDTRTLQPGDLFFAVAGENTDGHRFLEEAHRKGAAAAVVRQGHPVLGGAPKGLARIETADPLAAMQHLAWHHRRQFSLPVVGVTGSSGKTTTKDMTAAVLGEKRRVLSSKGSFNNEIGLPLTLLALEGSHEAAVLEMGMRGLGQIRELCRLAEPDIGIITNVGVAHLGLLGSQEKIFQAKGELAEAIPPGGSCILNGEDPWTPGLRERCRGDSYTFGFSPSQDLWAQDVTEEGMTVHFTAATPGQTARVCLPCPGRHNVQNALSAILTGLVLGMSLRECASGVEKTPLRENRHVLWAGRKGARILNDSYNANPDSMEASLQVLSHQPGRRIAVLGDMRELGAIEEEAHRQVGRRVRQLGIEMLVTVGDLGGQIAQGARDAGHPQVRSYRDRGEAARQLAEMLTPGDVVLVKGSRVMQMEEIAEELREKD